MATVKSKEGEYVYDVAARVYQDMTLGVADLLSLNSLTLDQPIPAGTELLFTDGLSRRVIPNIIPKLAEKKTFKTLEFQTVYDLAIQLYGDITVGLPKVLDKISNLDTSIVTGTSIEYDEGLFFTSFVSTGFTRSDVPPGEVVFILREDGFYLLREDGTKFIREEYAG
jgi:hypothetical protein